MYIRMSKASKLSSHWSFVVHWSKDADLMSRPSLSGFFLLLSPLIMLCNFQGLLSCDAHCMTSHEWWRDVDCMVATLGSHAHKRTASPRSWLRSCYVRRSDSRWTTYLIHLQHECCKCVLHRWVQDYCLAPFVWWSLLGSWRDEFSGLLQFSSSDPHCMTLVWRPPVGPIGTYCCTLLHCSMPVIIWYGLHQLWMYFVKGYVTFFHLLLEDIVL